MSRLGLPVLTYHAIDESGGVTSTSPAAFARTIGRLVEAGLIGVDLSNWIAQGRPTVDRGFAVVFDDGLRSILEGMEILDRYQVPSTVFLVTDHVGRRNDWLGQPRRIPQSPMLDWSEVTDLSRRGVRFGAHTATHPRLSRLGADALGAEIRGSRDAIESKLNRACGLFAYPYGDDSALVRERVARHFDAGFCTRLDFAQARHDPFELPRIDAYYLRSSQVVERLISGRIGRWLAVRRGLRAARRLAIAPRCLGVRGSRRAETRERLILGGRGGVDGCHASVLVSMASDRPGMSPCMLTSTEAWHPSIQDRQTTRVRERVCPECRCRIAGNACLSCGRHYPTVAGLPDFRLASDRYLDLKAERAKAERLAQIAKTTNLEGLARAYYAITHDVDPPRCRRYLRHILDADRRGEAVAGRIEGDGPVLEIGCGTGGLLVAAARRGIAIEGVDIASRWLVVARRRLDDAGLSVPLLAANADRLPYPDGSFATVVADSVIEHCDDPLAALQEWRRVLRPGGRLVLWSPNRMTLMTDPHVRLWGLGFLPRRWADAYARLRRGGAWVPRTQTARGASRLVREAGFEAIEARPPSLSSLGSDRLATVYEALRRFGPTRAALQVFGPLWSIEATAPTETPR